jgi:hypothetical protein
MEYGQLRSNPNQTMTPQLDLKIKQ